MTFGAYGKMAGLGDFLRFGLPRDFVQNWDAWLQAGIAAAERAFGDDWAVNYNSAPIWRFGLPAGAVDDAAMLGILMPSVDRVGRRFPLTLATEWPSELSLLAGYLHSETLFAQLEDIALSTLSGETTPVVLEEQLSQLTLPISGPAVTCSMQTGAAFERTGHGNAMIDAVAALCRAEDGLGYWSTQAVERSQAFVTSESPDAKLFLHLVSPFREGTVPA